MANIICSICIENLVPDKGEVDNVVTDCGHLYHDICLTQWLEKSPDCPDCNKLILVRRKVFLSTTDYDPQKQSLRLFFKYLMSSMNSLQGLSLLDGDQSESDLNDICNFLHGDHMGSHCVMEEFLGDRISELAENLFSTHVNILNLKEMVIERDNKISELKSKIANLKKQNDEMKKDLESKCKETEESNEKNVENKDIEANEKENEDTD